MELGEFKEYFESFEEGKVFDYGISEPFSWRGVYDEVAFSIEKEPMDREEILSRIDKAFTEEFYGYKGGTYTYNEFTPVNFEENPSDYSNGNYCATLISEVEKKDIYISQEFRLTNLLFK